MLFAPTDEIVELTLGSCQGSWERLPPRHAAKGIILPDDSNITKILTLLSFVVAAAAVVIVGILTKHPTAAILSGVVALAICFAGIMKLASAVYRSHRLGFFDYGIRYGHDLIRFDDLKLLSLGARKTVAERHFPTFRKMQRRVERLPHIRAQIELTRKLSVSPILNDGTHLLWLGMFGLFSKDQLDEFYDLMKARYPEKVFGTDLTPEERQQIEEM